MTLPSLFCICGSLILSIHVFDAILPPPGQWARLHQELQQRFLRELLLINKPEFRLVLLVLWNHWACAAQLVTSNVEIARLTD